MDFHFEGTLTARDAKRHISHRFSLPSDGPAIAELAIDFRFTPEGSLGVKNLLTLTLFDPQGFRGAAHRDGERLDVHLGGGPARQGGPARRGIRHRVRLAQREATPGYLPGPLPPGEWTVQIDTHMVMPGDPVRYSLDITVREEAAPGSPGVSAGSSSAFETGPSDAAAFAAANAATNAAADDDLPVVAAPTLGPGWYRGDFHTHTVHSDAAQHQTVAGLVAAARAHGLDFVFLTDHNTTSGLREMAAASTDGFLGAAGMELTTFWGHAVCLGTHEWIDWRIRPGTGAIARLAGEVYTARPVLYHRTPRFRRRPRLHRVQLALRGDDAGQSAAPWRSGTGRGMAARTIPTHSTCGTTG